MRTSFGQNFDVPVGYLNTASIGVPPAIVADEIERAVRSWRTGQDSATDFDAPVARGRAAFAHLIGVDPSTVAIGTAVSQLAGLIAASVPDGTRVLVAANDFTSVTFPFAAQAGRGVRVTEVPADRIPHTMDDFDMVAVSVVQSADGSVLDLDLVRERAAATGTKVLLDGTQAVGWMPLDLGWANWVIGASYKWLLSPRGACWLAIHPEELARTVPQSANWFAGQTPWESLYGLPLRLAEDARCLDLSPVWLAHTGAAVALPWLGSLDMHAVRAHCVGLANTVLDRLGMPSGNSPIISLDRPDAAEKLAAAGVRFAARAGRTRLAFALYTTEEDVDRVLAAIGC